MDKKQRVFLIILGMLMIAVAVLYGLNMLAPDEVPTSDVSVSERTTEEQIEKEPEVKEYVNVFFIGQNENHEEVYRAVK